MAFFDKKMAVKMLECCHWHFCSHFKVRKCQTVACELWKNHSSGSGYE